MQARADDLFSLDPAPLAPEGVPSRLPPPGVRTPSPADVEFPAFLADDYEYLGVLGEGGGGKVFWAIDRETSREVAIKVAAPTDPERTERELLLHLNLCHPRIMSSHHGGIHDGVAFFVLELAQRSLGDDGSAELSLEEWWRALGEVHEGLMYLHAQGLVHRDLKPGNVQLTESGAKISDLGMALDRRNPRITQRGAVLGTPGYMAPESARGETAEAPADIFALGVMVYRALEGRLPYPGDDPMEQMRAVASGHLLPLGRGRHLLSEEARECLEAALSVVPERRPKDLRPLLEDQPWLRLPPRLPPTGEPAEAEVFGAYQSPGPGAAPARPPWAAALCGVLGAVLFAVVLAGTVGGGRRLPTVLRGFPAGAGFRTGR